jgi:hypothetical protein
MPLPTKSEKVKHETVEKRPAGTAGSISALIVGLAAQFGLEISAELAVAIVGAVTALVSWLSQRGK